MGTVPTIKTQEAAEDYSGILCKVQERTVKVFCTEVYWRKIGKNWRSKYGERMALLNAVWLLQYNPTDAELLEVVNCWYQKRYHR